jgi:hypothetical protein
MQVITDRRIVIKNAKFWEYDPSGERLIAKIVPIVDVTKSYITNFLISLGKTKDKISSIIVCRDPKTSIYHIIYCQDTTLHEDVPYFLEESLGYGNSKKYRKALNLGLGIGGTALIVGGAYARKRLLRKNVTMLNPLSGKFPLKHEHKHGQEHEHEQGDEYEDKQGEEHQYEHQYQHEPRFATSKAEVPKLRHEQESELEPEPVVEKLDKKAQLSVLVHELVQGKYKKKLSDNLYLFHDNGDMKSKYLGYYFSYRTNNDQECALVDDKAISEKFALLELSPLISDFISTGATFPDDNQVHVYYFRETLS